MDRKLFGSEMVGQISYIEFVCVQCFEWFSQNATVVPLKILIFRISVSREGCWPQVNSAEKFLKSQNRWW